MVAHQDNTKLWLHTSLEDTAGTAPNHVLNAGEYQKNFTLESLVTPHSMPLVTRYTWYPTIGCMVIRDMAGHDGASHKQAMKCLRMV